MYTLIFFLLRADIKPIDIGRQQYINEDPLMGAHATSLQSAKAIMQKLTDTASLPLDASHRVFERPDLFAGFMINQAKIHDGHTILEITPVDKHMPSQSKVPRYRGILNYVWHKTLHNTQGIIEKTRQLIVSALDALSQVTEIVNATTAPPEKSKDVLLSELKVQNPEHVRFIQEVLKPRLNETRRAYRNVAQWDVAQIQQWKARFIQQPSANRNIPEMLAALMRAAQLAHGYVPRNVQLLSVLSCLYQKGKGRFLQVKTGEGKSLITAMLAASKVLLEDIPVDVLSSSSVLAERDILGQQKFYTLLGISAGFEDTFDSETATFYPQCQVVYGDMIKLIGDVLRQSYQGQPTRGKRPFAALIIDEVDSLLVDRANMICKLTTPLACSETLLPFLQLMWLQLTQLESATPLPGQTHKINQILEEFCETLLEGTNVHFQLPLPPFLKEFVRRQIPQWIRSARQAKAMQAGIHYLYIKGNPDEPGTIKIVDVEHTGVIETNMVWGDGLHQFLLLKHDGYIYPETLTSCYASTDAYLSFYKKNIFGLTGTLGDHNTRQFIQKTYGVSLLDIPPYTPKVFKEYPGRIHTDIESWKNAIVRAIQEETRKGRPVLVVNQSIRECGFFQEALSSLYAKDHVGVYVCNGQKVPDLKPGRVLLTTNLGGRGTDLETTPEIERAGGLHVIVTFLPLNQRVEDQAFGRTSRQGRKGTAQLIMCRDDPTETVDQLRAERVHKEDQRIADIQHKVIPKIRLGDRLFNSIDMHMGSLLNGIPLDGHPDQEKIRQVDLLWALQHHRLDNYKNQIYHQWQKALSLQLASWDLTLGQNVVALGETDVQALYKRVHLANKKKAGPSVDALKSRVLSHLLSQKSIWRDAELNQFCEEFLDTSQVSDDLLQALCHVTNCTYVCIDHTGAMRIAKHYSYDAPVICLGMIVGQPVVPDLSVLQALYPGMECAQPEPLKPSQMPNALYLATLNNDSVSAKLRTRIYQAPSIYPVHGMQNDHPRLQDVLTLMADKTHQRQAQQCLDESRYQIRWVNGFLENLKTLYAQGDSILIVPSELDRLARKSTNPSAADALFARAVKIPHLYKAMVYYNWANTIIYKKAGDYKARALRRLERCADKLNQQIQLWQYITVFAGEQAGANPITCQVRGRIGMYSDFLSNIRHNIAVLQGAGAQDQIAINLQENINDLIHRVDHFTASDAVQVKNQGLDTLSLYTAVRPESSFGDIVMVNILGVFQTILGGIMTSSGIPFGPAILTSGLQDIWRGVKSAFTGVFSWESYWFDKSIEVLTAAVSHVYGVIKNNVLQIKSAVSTAVAQRSVMDTIVQAAKTVLINNVTAELRTRAVTMGVATAREDMKQAVCNKVEQFLAEPPIRIHIEHASWVAHSLDMYLSLFQDMLKRVKARTEAQQRDVYQILSHLTKTCMEQHHRGSRLATLVSGVATGVQTARQAHEVMGCVDNYIQMLREEVTVMASNIPSIELFLTQLYMKHHHTAPPNIVGEFVSYLQSYGIFVGNRPYLVQNTLDNTGVRRYANNEQVVAGMQQMAQQVMNQNRLTALLFNQDNDLKLFKLIINYIYTVNQRTEPVFYKSMVKEAFIENGTQLLFNKTITLADDFALQSMRLTQTALQSFRKKVEDVQKSYGQPIHHWPLEPQSAPATQQAVRPKAAALPPQTKKSTYGEADTPYTKALNSYLHGNREAVQLPPRAQTQSEKGKGPIRDPRGTTSVPMSVPTTVPSRPGNTEGLKAYYEHIAHTPTLVEETAASSTNKNTYAIQLFVRGGGQTAVAGMGGSGPEFRMPRGVPPLPGLMGLAAVAGHKIVHDHFYGPSQSVATDEFAGPGILATPGFKPDTKPLTTPAFHPDTKPLTTPVPKQQGPVILSTPIAGPQNLTETYPVSYPGGPSILAMARGEPNKGLAGKNHPVTNVPFDKQSQPSFRVAVDLKITEEDVLKYDRGTHARAATRVLREKISKGEISPDLFTDEQLTQIKAGKEKINPYTWHHHGDRGRMQLVDEEIHKKTGHQGGFKIWKSENEG